MKFLSYAIGRNSLYNLKASFDAIPSTEIYIIKVAVINKTKITEKE